MKQKDSLEFAQIVCQWVKDVYPELVKHADTFNDRCTISIYLQENTKALYTNMLFMYGVLYYLAVIQYFAENEEYERCELMLSVIKEENLKFTKEHLPLSLEDESIKKWKDLSPKEIIVKYLR